MKSIFVERSRDRARLHQRSRTARARVAHLRAYDVGVKGTGHSQLVNATSPGQAKSRYQREYLYDLDIPFTQLTCRSMGAPVDDGALARTAAYRGVPFATLGMRVEVGGSVGQIAGVNSSANFNVFFESGPHKGQTLNCHPNWEMKYFGADGAVLADFTKGAQ